jgi:hypothetical protein
MQKIHVWYKLSGEIVAVGRAVGNANCLPVSGAEEFVLEAEVEESYIPTLGQTHAVDPLRQSIVKLQSK